MSPDVAAVDLYGSDAWRNAFGTGSSVATSQPAAALTVEVRAGVRIVGVLGAPLIDRFDPADGRSFTDEVLAAAREVEGTSEARWAIRLDQLDRASVVATQLAARVSVLRVVPAAPVHLTEIDDDRRVEHYLGTGFRKQARRAVRALEATVASPDAVRLERVDAARVGDRLGTIAGVRESRDLATNRIGPLSRQLRQPFEQLVTALALDGRVEIAILWAGERVAAYNLAVRDGATWRVLDGRVSPDIGGVSAGRVVDQAIVEWALADPSCTRLDWGRGSTSAKARVSNRVVDCVHVLGASDRRAFVVAHGPWLARARAARFRREHPAVDRVWLPLKRAWRR